MSKQKSLNISTNKRYEKFIRSLELIGIGLETSSVRLRRREYVSLRREGKEPIRRISTDYQVSKLAKISFDCIGNFNLIVAHPESKETVLQIECSFGAHFHTDSKDFEDMARRFVSSEFKLIIWPYFRQFVTDVTSRMSIAPVVVPFSTRSLAP